MAHSVCRIFDDNVKNNKEYVIFNCKYLIMLLSLNTENETNVTIKKVTAVANQWTSKLNLDIYDISVTLTRAQDTRYI